MFVVSVQNKSPDEMLSHIQHHLNTEYLKVSELKALRKQARHMEKSGAATGRPKQPLNFHRNDTGSSSQSDSDDSQAPSPGYQQDRTTNFDNSLVKYSIRQSEAEQQDTMLLFSNKRQQLLRISKKNEAI